MKRLGLCSITFRGKSETEILGIVATAGLDAVEWGGDVHVPPADEIKARLIGELTRIGGLETLSYGSYYRCESAAEFDAVSSAAEVLGAKTIRVWAGNKDAEKYSEQEFYELTQTVKACADIAARRGQTIAFEYHFGTYNNSPENTLKLIKAVGKENVKTYWQPAYWLQVEKAVEIEQNVRAITLIKDYIAGVHVYNWEKGERLPLKAASEEWRRYCSMIGDNNYFLEFVKGDSEQSFFADAEALKNLWL